MTEVLRTTDELSLFQKMLRGQMAAHFILNSRRLGVAAVLDIFPAEHAQGVQAVVFPYRPGSSSRWEMATRMRVAAAVQAVSDRIETVYQPDLVVKHEEGYGVLNHGHVVIFPSFGRGESAALHDPLRTAQPVADERLADTAAKLRFSSDEEVAFESDVWHGAGQIYGLL